MHHFIFPSQDTYITNRPNFTASNFGVDEILQVGTENRRVSYISPTKDYVYVGQIFNHVGVEFFNGQFTGSVTGTDATSSYAQFTGSVNGAYSGSFVVSDFTGSITSGSVICLFGTASGVDTRVENTRLYKNEAWIDRALLQFDITAISNSISMSQIVNPAFTLRVKICNEYEIPINYSIYAYPIFESWDQGTGYMSDGGSDDGASWAYRDYSGGTPWAQSGSSYTVPACSQSFHYRSADLNMDITPIVNAWLAGLPNNGVLLISSDESQPTGSGFTLKYFSRDTNTIYSPVLDVGWDDSEFVTGSFATSSVVISHMSGSNTIVYNGSSLTGAGGVHGNFYAACFIDIHAHYITASNTVFTGSFAQQFTGSFSGSFYGIATAQGYFTGSGGFSASFTGSVDGVDTEVTSSDIAGTNVEGYIVGDVSMPSYLGTFSGSLQGSALALQGTASGQWLDETYNYYVAFISGSGISGNISQSAIIGIAEGLIAKNTVTVVLPYSCSGRAPSSPYESPYYPGLSNPTNSPYAFIDMDYVWMGDQVGWSSTIPPYPSSSNLPCSCQPSHSVQIMSGSFLSGPFSGSTFIGYYENYKIIFAGLTGSWNASALAGANVYIPLPQAMYPYVTAYINGFYVYGTAMGYYLTSSNVSESLTSASFNGQFTSGPFLGAYVSFQLTGSATTVPYDYTSSVAFTSSVLTALDVERPFSINLQNLQPTYKSGDIIKLNVFGRKKHPLKDFGILTQQVQYLVPEYLPPTTYYALKDNQTDEIVVNFDSYTRVSCEYPGGNYFLIDTTGLPQERYFRVLIRVEDGTLIDTIDTGKIFKITR